MPSRFTVKRRNRGAQTRPLLVVVGRSVATRAVVRNLLKRRLRAVMREVLKKEKSDFLVIAKPGAAKLTFGEIKKEILERIR